MRKLALVLVTLMAGCVTPDAPPPPEPPPTPIDRVVLLPRADGTTGAIVVTQGSGEVLLDTAYATASAGSDGKPELGKSDLAGVRADFGSVLDAMPRASASFVVYFVFGQEELTEDSKKVLPPVLDAIAGRPAPDVTVTGHTDQVGTQQLNDTLSLRRAERVKELLVQRGVPANRILTAGRGSREPVVRAPEGTSEVLNRRVEISVR